VNPVTAKSRRLNLLAAQTIVQLQDKKATNDY